MMKAKVGATSSRAMRLCLFALACISILSTLGCQGGDKEYRYRPAEAVLRVTAISVNPDPVALNGTVTIVLDVQNDLPLASTLIDLSPIGGNAATALLDSGQNGDAVADDARFTVQAMIPANTPNGRSDLPFVIRDLEGNQASGIVGVIVDAEVPNLQHFNVSASSLTRGTDALLTINVTSAAASIAVTADLTELGLGASVAFNDAGTNGDVTAGDGIWSLSIAPALGVTPGSKTITISATANGKSEVFMVSVTVANQAPLVNSAMSTVLNGEGAAQAGPQDTVDFSIAATDADGTIDSVTVDLSNIGLSSAINLTYNALNSRWEGQGVIPSTNATGLVQIVVVATDNNSQTHAVNLPITIINWVGIAGSSTGHGVASSAGWALGSAVASDADGNIYVAYSQRVDVPASISGSGWIYAVYVKKYDVANDIWVGLDGSDAGLGLNVNTSGQTISSGYVRSIEFYAESQQGANNKQGIYVVFDGDPDTDASESLWDTFIYRWNITDGVWESIGVGVDASDYINPTPTASVDDAGGVTKSGARAQEASLAFDSATDDIYLAYHANPGAEYAVYLRRFDRSSGVWQDIAGTTGDEGISDDNASECKFPEIAIYGNYLYCVYNQEDESSSTFKDNVVIRRLDITTDTWDAVSMIYDDLANSVGAGAPEVVIDSVGNLWVGYKLTFTSPTDQQFHIVTASTADWNVPANYLGAGGGSSIVTLPMSTNSSVIQPRLVVDSQDRILTTFQQEHPGMSGSERNVMVTRWNGLAWEGILGSYSGNGITINPNEIDWLPWICVDPQDRPVVSWDSYNGPAGGSANDRRKVFVKTIR